MSDKEEFTPPLDWIRDAYADENYGTRSIDDSYAAFDRAMAKVRADALRAMAARYRATWAPEPCPWVGALDDEATKIEGEAGLK